MPAVRLSRRGTIEPASMMRSPAVKQIKFTNNDPPNLSALCKAQAKQFVEILAALKIVDPGSVGNTATR